jgi:hypothetical protein
MRPSWQINLGRNAAAGGLEAENARIGPLVKILMDT